LAVKPVLIVMRHQSCERLTKAGLKTNDCSLYYFSMLHGHVNYYTRSVLQM